METKRCIFCMQEMPTEEKKCPACGKGPWQYQWKPGWIQPYTILYDRYLIGAALEKGPLVSPTLHGMRRPEKRRL